MESHDELWERVRAFVAKECGVHPDSVKPETTLAWDIGLAGDSAVEFFEAFAEEFGVDLDSFRALDFRKHFGDEGQPLWLGCVLVPLLMPFILFAGYVGLANWIGLVIAMPFLLTGLYVVGKVQARRNRADAEALRVNDLVAAAAAKRWAKLPGGLAGKAACRAASGRQGHKRRTASASGAAPCL